MAINQLFIQKPPKPLLESIFQEMGRKLSQGQTFTYSSIDKNLKDIVEKLVHIKPFYLTCKARIYFNDLIPKKIITILRHCVKLYDFKIESKEIYKNKGKILEFRLVEINKPIKISLDFN
tara:strand:- start:1430 stop:1789 length:360 start_codon:yes stop_codon:yes gene_type:complete